MYLSGYAVVSFARLPRFTVHLTNLATELLLRPVLVNPGEFGLRSEERIASLVYKHSYIKWIAFYLPLRVLNLTGKKPRFIQDSLKIPNHTLSEWSPVRRLGQGGISTWAKKFG